MNGLMRQESSNQINAIIYGPGLEAQLTLYTPNNKDIYDIKKCKFYKELEDFQYRAINDVVVAELKYLKDEIKDYCCAYDFVTYENQPALELFIYDARDRVRRC